MDKQRWEKVQEIFEKALEVEISKRTVIVTELAEGDKELVQEVLALLDADASEDSLLEKPAVELFDFEKPASLVGKEIGKYKLIKQIGYGGMGAVYLAERTDKQFNQQVALKLIKRGMDSEEILKRFNSERQILAKLNHPNIAALYDGGITDDGLPYFTMEYIQGDQIDVYCDKNALSIDERLKLFLSVLKAVQYAQKNLIVHRDLKPSNIIITHEGQVKLLDFGIAKLLDNNTIDDTIEQTKTVFRIMTPGYASPEQVKGEPITTASDVYSLGVILFELLTGHRPYITSGVSPLELEKLICNTDPQKPSTIVTKKDNTYIGDDVTNSEKLISESRQTNPERLKKILNGDIDNICLKSLEKEQERRYNSAEQLAEDIERYLNGHPVHARPATVGYKFRKFIKRNKTYVAAAAIVLILIVSLVSFYTIQLSDERDKANLEAIKAKQVTEYISSIFEIANPSESKGETITAKEIVDQGYARIEEELGDQPEVQTEIMTVISNVYYSLGMLEKAREVIRQTLEIRENYFGKFNIMTAESYHDLGDVNYDLGHFEAADSFYTIALEIKDNVLEPNDTLIALELISLGTVARLNSDFEKSLAIYERALEIQLNALEKPHADIAYTMNNLGRLYQQNDMYDKAEPILVEALEIRRELFGELNFETIASTGSVASLYTLKGKYDEAAALYERANNSLNQMVGDDHHYSGAIKCSYARAELYREKYDHAEELFRKGMQILNNTLPKNHVNTSQAYTGLGMLFVKTNQPDTALIYLDTSLIIKRLSLPEDHYQIAITKAYLGRAYYLKNDYTTAKTYLETAYDIFSEKYGDKNYNTQKIIAYLVDLYTAVGDESKTVEFSEKVI